MKGQPRLSVGAASVFGVRTFNLVMVVGTTFALARVLGPSDLGAYYLLTLIAPASLALFSFGIPAAMTYHAGQGRDLDGIRTLALALALGVSLLIVATVLILSSALASTVLAAAPPDLVPIAAAAIPGVFLASFCNSIVLGRHALATYSRLIVFQSASMFVGEVCVVWLASAGLIGALLTYVLVMTTSGILSMTAMLRLEPFRPHISATLTKQVVRYGVLLQPASLAGYFSYRADAFLMSALLRDPIALGVYGLAVNIAELCFYIADSISTVLFPRIAASTRHEADAAVPAISRTAMALTGSGALALAAATVIGIPLALPVYAASVLPALVLLPAVVALSASKILSGYLSGIGRPGMISVVASLTLGLNVVANLVLIPPFGPAGAATASLVSYSVNGSLMIMLAARHAGVTARAMIVPRVSDLVMLRRIIGAPARSR